jgi:hypothetical protein
MMMRSTILLILTLFVGALVAYAAAGLLDGKTFEGDTGTDGKTTVNTKDTVSFADGKLHSTGCDQYGFTPSDYKAHQDGDKIKFESTATSEKEGKMVWKGTVTGDSCEGTMVWSKKGQKDIEYWFKGTLKK